MKYLTIDELAERWKMKRGTFANWRNQGKGPRYQKIGKKVLYPLSEVEKFERENMKRSTA